MTSFYIPAVSPSHSQVHSKISSNPSSGEGFCSEVPPLPQRMGSTWKEAVCSFPCSVLCLSNLPGHLVSLRTQAGKAALAQEAPLTELHRYLNLFTVNAFCKSNLEQKKFSVAWLLPHSSVEVSLFVPFSYLEAEKTCHLTADVERYPTHLPTFSLC